MPYAFVNNRGARTYAIDWTKPGRSSGGTSSSARSMDLGFEGWMHDFGEFVTEGMRFADGTPPETMHNRYPVLLHEAARSTADRYAAAHPGFEPFFYVRSGFDGVQRATGAVFPGDETTDWAQGSGPPQRGAGDADLAMGGFPTFTTDVAATSTSSHRVRRPSCSPAGVSWLPSRRSCACTTRRRTRASTRTSSRAPNSTPPPLRPAQGAVSRRSSTSSRSRASATAASGRCARWCSTTPRRGRSVDDQWLLGATCWWRRAGAGRDLSSVYLPAGSSWQPVRVADDGLARAGGRGAPRGAAARRRRDPRRHPAATRGWWRVRHRRRGARRRPPAG
jgi:hypothetical protein